MSVPLLMISSLVYRAKDTWSNVKGAHNLELKVVTLSYDPLNDDYASYLRQNIQGVIWAY